MYQMLYIDHFYSCVLSYLSSVNASEAGGDLALIQTSLLFSFKCQQLDLHNRHMYQNKVM